MNTIVKIAAGTKRISMIIEKVKLRFTEVPPERILGKMKRAVIVRHSCNTKQSSVAVAHLFTFGFNFGSGPAQQQPQVIIDDNTVPAIIRGVARLAQTPESRNATPPVTNPTRMRMNMAIPRHFPAESSYSEGF